MPENEKQTNKERLKDITDSIERGIQDLFQSDKYAEYLRTMSRFHKYSVNNTMLIYMQKPDATLVAGFNKWRDQFERNVLKGEKGIKIIAPTPFKKKIEQEKRDPDTNLPMLDADGKVIIEEKEIKIPMFKPVTVFDVSQTDGKPLPQLASDLQGNVQNYEVFMEALRRSSPVPIEIKPIADNADGFFSLDKQSITIREGMSEVQTVSAVVHEIAHSKLHNDKKIEEPKDAPKYQEVEIFDVPALFSNGRISLADLPEGLYRYDLRGSDDDHGMPVTVEQNVAVNHAGAIITAKPLNLGEEGRLYLTEEEGLNFVGGEISMQRFFNEQRKDRNTEEVEAESISFAVCAYYGIATGENSFGYIATWSKDKELKELRASLETINTTSSELITDIDRHYAEIMKERETEMAIETEEIPLEEMNILQMVDYFMEQGMTEEQANELANAEWQARDVRQRGNDVVNKEKLDALYAENPIGDDDWFFHHPDTMTFEAVYFNPDSTAGGQYVIMTLPYELISDAVEQTNDTQSFFEFLEERASHTELVDITDEDFRATMESYKNRTADFVGRSDEVMTSLITTVAKEVDDPVLSFYTHDDKQIGTLYDVLHALKINDVELSYDESGTLIATDSDNKWTGKEFYSFLINEAFVYEDNGSVLGISDELYANFKALATENGVYTGDNALKNALTDFVEEIARKVQEEEPVQTPDNGYMPDPSMSIEAMNAYGYMDSDMLPLSKERALELFERDVPIYMLYEGNTEAMAFEAEDIVLFSGCFGITREDWDAIKDEVPPMDLEIIKQKREQAFLESPGDTYAIYQLKNDDTVAELRFMNSDHLKVKGVEPQYENYELVYTGALTQDGSQIEKLEDLYRIFNIEHPQDFTGHSLSISDIVALKQAGVVSYHYVDSIGYKELHNFRNTDNHLKNAEMQVEDDYGMIDGVINNAPKEPVKAPAPKKEETKAKKPSVLAKLRQYQDEDRKATTQHRSAERDLI